MFQSKMTSVNCLHKTNVSVYSMMFIHYGSILSSLTLMAKLDDFELTLRDTNRIHDP